MEEKNITLLLGGQDAEMQAIKDLAKENSTPYLDKNLGWGAKAIAYQEEVRKLIEEGKTPVLVELSLEGFPPELIDKIVVIDHHGANAHLDPAIIQVVELMGWKISRLITLIGANDADYIPGMQKLGATSEEIALIRQKERAAQGITLDQEAQAESAIRRMERCPELNDLIIIHLPHSKTATITDRLFEIQKRQNILILSNDGEVNYFGDGGLCKILNEKFQGWAGGSGLGQVGENAYWGGYPDQGQVEVFIKESQCGISKIPPAAI